MGDEDMKCTFDTQAKCLKVIAVRLVQIEGKLVAARGFSGLLNDNNTNQNGKLLLDAICKYGISPLSTHSKPWYCGGFNPPWTISFMRTNEVYIDVSEQDLPSSIKHG